jgi:ParB family chromosome partitioning protein
MIPIKQIQAVNRMRSLNRGKVEAFAASIKVIGPIYPIKVRPIATDEGGASGPRYMVVDGAHRLEAHRKLGVEKIPALVDDLDDHLRRLHEIDANLIRNELTVLEKDEHLAERKRIYEELHPETRRGAQGGRGGNRNETDKLSFSKSSAQILGCSDRGIERSVQRATGIDQGVRDRLRGSPCADQAVELNALVQLSPAQQRTAVDKVEKGLAKSLREATLQLAGETNQARDAARSKDDRDRERLTKLWREVSQDTQAWFRSWINSEAASAKGMDGGNSAGAIGHHDAPPTVTVPDEPKTKRAEDKRAKQLPKQPHDEDPNEPSTPKDRSPDGDGEANAGVSTSPDGANDTGAEVVAENGTVEEPSQGTAGAKGDSSSATRRLQVNGASDQPVSYTTPHQEPRSTTAVRPNFLDRTHPDCPVEGGDDVG